MNWDDLDDRLRRAAASEDAAVERVVSGALTGRGGPRLLRLTLASAVAVCLFAVGAWWMSGQAPSKNSGVYRVEALPPAGPSLADSAQMPAPPVRPGVYRAKSDPASAPPSQVIRITAGTTTWILSTNAGEGPLPYGSAVIIGGEEER
jgi:hypothetical protein